LFLHLSYNLFAIRRRKKKVLRSTAVFEVSQASHTHTHTVPVLSTRVCYIVPLCRGLLSLHSSTGRCELLESSVRSLQSNNPVGQTERAREERACVSFGLTETSPWFGPDQYTIFCHWTPETTARSRSIKEQRLSLIINEEDYDTGAEEAKHTVCDVLSFTITESAFTNASYFVYDQVFVRSGCKFSIFVSMSFYRPENETLLLCFKCKISEAYGTAAFISLLSLFSVLKMTINLTSVGLSLK